MVHVQHGIGQYIGIQTLETNGTHKDFLMIAYRGDVSCMFQLIKFNLFKNLLDLKEPNLKFINWGLQIGKKQKPKLRKV